MKSLELIESIRNGPDSRTAQAELYRRVQTALLERLRHRLPDRIRRRMEAEDVLNEAFLRAMAALEGFHATQDKSFYAWVYTIAKNLMFEVHRRRSLLAIPITRSAADGPGQGRPRESQIPAPGRGVSTVFARHDWVESMLDRLRDPEAEIIRLRLLEGLSFDEIAARSGKTSGAVQRSYSRAFQRLRKLAEDLGEAGLKNF